MKRTSLTKCFVSAALLLLSLPMQSQTATRRLQAASQSQIVNISATPQRPVTDFGRHLVERLKQEGRRLPMAEERLLRMKPGKSRHYVRPVATGEKPLTFTGMLQYNEFGGRMLLEYGFYKFSQKNGFVRETMANVDHDLNGRGAYYNHKLHGTSSIELPYLGSGQWTYCEWDADTWEPTGNHGSRLGANDLIVKDADTDPTTGICYGWKDSGTSGQLFLRLNYEQQAREIISSSDSLVVMLAVNSKGQMYGVTENGSFCSIDKSNGRLTYIGSFDFPFYSVFESMTFDRRTDRLYAVCTEVDEETEEMFGRLCEIDVNTGRTTLIAYLPEAEEYTCLNLLTEPDDEAPAAISDLFVNFPSEAGAGVGVMNFSVPTTTVSGQPLEGTVHYVITVNDDDANPIEGDAQPGGFVAKPITVKAEGRQKVVVVLSSNGHEGCRNVNTGWVGTDTPQPSAVTFAYDEATSQATLTWNGNRGQHGGYVRDALTYDVYRFPGEVKVATGISDTKFTETFGDINFDAYYYRVVPFRGEEEGAAALSNKLYIGRAYDVPFTDDFEASTAGNRYTAIDANGDGRTWDFVNYSSTTGRMRYEYSKTEKADDWCLTPPIHMVEGVAYQLKFDAFSVSPAYKERIAVACGQGTDPTTFQLIIPETEISTSIQAGKELTGEIKVMQTGDYRFAFHALSDVFQNSLFVDNLQVTAGQLLITPDSVRNLQLTAAPDGDMVVTISFDAPSVANDGTALESLSRIVITRGEKQEPVATLTDVKPGQHCTYTDGDAMNGMLTYNVTAWNEAGAGLTATASVYVGTDAPAAPVQAALADNLDGTATLSWTAPVIGQNGGYVDPDELTYNIYSVVNNALQQVKSDVSGLSYQVTGIPQNGAQGQTIYGVSAVNELGESPTTVAAPLIYGAPYTLPFMEGFLSSGLKGIWATRSNVSGTSWRMYTGMSADGDDCVTGVEAEKAGAVAQLSSGKISLAGAVTPKLVFAAFGDPGTDNRLRVVINKNGAAEGDTLLTVDYKEQTVEDFIVYAVDLSAYKDAKYITATFVAELNDKRMRMILVDDVNFRNVDAYNLATYADVQSRTTAGQPAKMKVTVHNVGEQPATGYHVNLFVNGHQVKSFEGTSAIAPFDRATFSYDYLTLPTDPEQSSAWAVVDYNLDLDEADNTCPAQQLIVVPSQLEAVSSLAATSADGKSTLVWSPVSGRNDVTESFEGYEPFSTTFGQWTCYDQDRCETAGINGLWWPGTNQPQAFITFDFRKAGVTEAQMRQYPQFEANNGQQFAAAFKANNAPSNRNNDWLVSPELSGQEQTIRLYAQSLAGVWNETFEVLYSTTGNKVTDFSQDNVIDEFEAPNNYFGRFQFTLPAGAKYFAIHCNTANGGIFMVDDISYSGRQLTLKGYNIYCDGQLVGTADATAQTYEHSTTTLPTGLHTYHVTALYAEGESALSNAAPVAVINAISSVGASQGVSISAREGFIQLHGVKGMPVSVYTTAGMLVYRGTPTTTDATITLRPGQYIVKAADKVSNIIVR